MDRARRTGTPALSKLNVRSKKNRRRPGSVWSRLPKPAAIATSCGRVLRRSLPALAAAAGVATVTGALFVGYRWVTRSPRFEITAIEVTGTTHLSADAIRAAIPAEVGTNIFRVNLGAIERSVATDPWIASVSAHRELPHTLVVDITERTAAAVAQVGPDAYLVDHEGHPFKRATLDEQQNLPVVTGLDRTAFARDAAGTATTVLAALAVLATWDDGQRPHATSIEIDSVGSLVVHPAGADTQLAAIDLGTIGDDLSPRLSAFDATWAELAPDERADLRTIHLGARPDHVTVAFAKD